MSDVKTIFVEQSLPAGAVAVQTRSNPQYFASTLSHVYEPAEPLNVTASSSITSGSVLYTKADVAPAIGVAKLVASALGVVGDATVGAGVTVGTVVAGAGVALGTVVAGAGVT